MFLNESLINKISVNELINLQGDIDQIINNEFMDGNVLKNDCLPVYPLFKKLKGEEQNKREQVFKKFIELLNKTYRLCWLQSFNSKYLKDFFIAHQDYLQFLCKNDGVINYTRMDFTTDENGSIKFFETNANGGFGLMFSHFLWKSAELVPGAKEAQKPKSSDFFWVANKMITNEKQKNREKGDIFLLFSQNNPFFDDDDKSYIMELIKLQQSLNRMTDKKTVHVTDPKNVTEDHHISTILSRTNCSRISMPKMKEYHSYLNVMKSSKIEKIINLAGLTVLQDKSFFHLLHEDPFQMYTLEEKKFIENHIPYTVKLEQNTNLDDFVNDRQDYLLKPCNGAHAEGVLFGEFVSKSEWSKILNNNRNGEFIVQKRIKGKPDKVGYFDGREFSVKPCYYVQSAYYFMGEILCEDERISLDKQIVNLASGAYRPILYSNNHA